MPDAACVSRSTNSSYVFFWTKIREPAQHTCPWFLKITVAELLTANSMLASSKIMFGDLPPSSKETRFKLLAAACKISLPTEVEPVKAMSRCRAMAAPAVGPKPVMMLTTPAGSPASRVSLPKASAGKGVCSAGLRTTVLPHARAGATFHATIESGPFHGIIWPQTPSGSRRV